MACFLIFLPRLQPMLKFLPSPVSNSSSDLVRQHGFWGCIRVGDRTPIGLCRGTVGCCGMCHRNVLVLLLVAELQAGFRALIWLTAFICCCWGCFSSHLNDSTHHSWKKGVQFKCYLQIFHLAFKVTLIFLLTFDNALTVRREAA